MKTRTLRSDLLILLATAIWGFAFVAQRVGMEHMGPFWFNALRFSLGSLILLPLLGRRDPAELPAAAQLWVGLLAGGILFLGASTQQIGLVYTTAGKAGFITGLYVVFVPLVGMLLGQRTYREAWLGAGLAAAGMYLLSVAETLSVNPGDLLVLASAICWAFHIHLIDRYAHRMPPFRLAFVQFVTCAGLSSLSAMLFENPAFTAALDAWKALLYAGVLSVGIGYTLQVVAQREAHPTHAAILFSLEAVFAALGGWWLLNETLTTRQLFGCGFMLGGMLLSQLRPFSKRKALTTV
jgi:drug/metabolite transporter (DMT)-like permease